jgi:O-antigen ligase
LLIAYFYIDFVKSLFTRPSYNLGNYTSYRFDIWQTSLHESFEYVWFGQGASHKSPIYIATGEQFSHSHNILLSVFRMSGSLGVLLFVTNLVLCLIAGFKAETSTHKIWIIWLVFGLICLLSNGKYPLTRPSSTWFAYWIPIAFICASSPRFLPIKNNK